MIEIKVVLNQVGGGIKIDVKGMGSEATELEREIGRVMVTALEATTLMVIGDGPGTSFSKCVIDDGGDEKGSGKRPKRGGA